jgi:Na+-transporting NADH:ubiquinone oxidoreductase subunit F
MVTAFLTAVGVLCCICGVLALFLVIADRIVNNYGTCKVDINEGSRELEVRGGDSLLSLLGEEKIFIPSACGGRGSCGLCKLKIKRGGGPVLPPEEPHLAPEERESRVRLSCQVKVREDMAIEIPDELFAIKEYRGKVTAIRDLTHDIKSLRIELLDPATVDFKAGQYMQLVAPAHGKSAEPVYRAYSISSDPADDRHVEFIIRLVPEGICTTWVFTLLREGDEVKLNGPYGEFYLRDTEAEMICIAGGSGMAPIRSILFDMKRKDIRRKCRYFFGARAVRDLFYLDELRALEQAMGDFRFIPALSEPAPEDKWDGETGLITDVVDRHYDECASLEAYLCGSPGMINACVKVLMDHGLPEEKIYYDKFQ